MKMGEVIFKSKNRLEEARIYPAKKRTLNICSRGYFVYFPSHVIYHKITTGSPWESDNGSRYYVGLLKNEDHKNVYFPPLPNVFGSDGHFCDEELKAWHGKIIPFEAFEEYLWNINYTQLRGWARAEKNLQNSFSNYNNWAKMTDEEVDVCLDKLEVKSLIAFLEGMWK